MTANTKSTKLEEMTIDYTLYTKGLERTIELSKSGLDQAVKQNAEILAAIKKALKGTSLPGLFVLDLAGEAIEGFVAVQKSLLDLALEQNNASIEAVQAYGKDADKAKAELATFCRPR